MLVKSGHIGRDSKFCKFLSPTSENFFSKNHSTPFRNFLFILFERRDDDDGGRRSAFTGGGDLYDLYLVEQLD